MNLLDKIVKELDSDKVFKFSEVDAFTDVFSWVSTGSPYLDYGLNTHGYPNGIIECRGKSQSGKTTFSLEAMKCCIKQYKDKAVVVILSSERRDNRELAEMIGLKVDDVLIVRTKTIEEVFNSISRIIDSAKTANGGTTEGLRFFFVWDSIGQTVSKQEADALLTRKENKKKDDDTKSAAMGSAARANSLGLRGLVSMLDDVDLTLFMINRAYENIGSVGKTSYGGTAIEFYPTIRMDLTRKEGIKIGEEEVGQITKVNVFKTDFSKPKQVFEIEIGYGYGIVMGQKDIELGIELGVLDKNGVNGAMFNDKLKWTSRRGLYNHYEDKNPMLEVMMQKMYKAVHTKVNEERAARINKK